MSLLRRLADLPRVASFCVLAMVSLNVQGQTQTQPTNASFETPAYGSNGRTASPSGANWTFAGTAGIERLSSAWSNAVGGYNGNQVAYLTSTGTVASLGSVAQNVNFPQAGQYYLRFQAGRIGADNAFKITVAGTQVDSFIKPRAVGGPGAPQLDAWWTVPFTISTPGTYQIKFQATDTAATLANGDVLMLDQVVVAYATAAFPNGSFESAGGWTISGYAAIDTGGPAGISGDKALRLRYASYGGGVAQSIPVTVAAGRYSVSARMAKSGSGDGCPQIVSYNINGTSFNAVSLPPPEESDFAPYTSSSFDLPAGTYYFYLWESCGGNWATTLLDALVLNRAGPNFANASFETPDLGAPANETATPRQLNPPGSSWTFSGFVSRIQGNSGAYIYSEPRTTFGKQYADIAISSGTITQTISVDQGAYVLVPQASDGWLRASVNGQLSDTMRGTTQFNSANSGARFAEVTSDPFTIVNTASVDVGFASGGSTGFSADLPRLIQVSGNLPPNVTITSPALASGKTYAIAQGPNAVGVMVTVSASDVDGLQANSVKVLNNNVQVGASGSSGTHSVTLPALAAGMYTLAASATDSQGMTGTTSRSLKINNPPQGGFTLSPSGIINTSAGTPVSVVVSPVPSDTDGVIVRTEVLLDGVNQGACTRYASPWGCTLSISARSTPYSVNVRATDDDGGSTLYAASTLTVNALPSISIVSPSNGASLPYGALNDVTASALDTDDGIAGIQIKDGQTTIRTCSFTAAGGVTRTCTATLSATASVGQHSLTAVATDAIGATTTSTVVSVNVAVMPPTGCAITGPSVLAANTSGTWSASCSGGSPATSYSWQRDGIVVSGAASSALTQVPFSTALDVGTTYAVTVGNSSGTGAASTFVKRPALWTLVAESGSGGAAVVLTGLTSSVGFRLHAQLGPYPSSGTITFTENGSVLCTSVASPSAPVGDDAGSSKSGGIHPAVMADFYCDVLPVAVTPGNHTYTATYVGTGDLADAVATITLKPLATMLLAANPQSVSPGQSFALTATIAPSDVTGTVDFKEGNITICAGVAMTGTNPRTASCTVAGKAATGSYPFVAAYGGDASHSSASANISVAVGTPVSVGSPTNVTTSNGGSAVVGSLYTLRVPITDAGSVSLNVSGVTGATTSCNSSGIQYCDVSWMPNTPGIQSVTIAVTDSRGATTTARTTVVVQDAPAASSMANTPTADAPVDALVGKVAGSFSVSEGGSAGYSIPIQVPPGVSGLQPSLALGYSSGGSYGTMGIGWSVSGLGAISRCPNTIAQDGFRAPVNYDNQESNDAYCLGGQRLVPVSDLVSAGNVTLTYNPPVNASVTVPAYKQVFRTEIESYARITGYKEWPQFTAGFSRFMVETKDGRVMHYSRRFKPMTNGYDTCLNPNQPLSCTNGVIASRVKIFVLDRVEDMAGNRMDIEYHTTRPTNTSESTYVVDWDVIGSASGPALQGVGGNGSYPPTEILPKVIKYASGHEVRFTYDEHPLTAQLRSFDSGAGEGVITQRLTGIEAWADGVMMKRYALGYDTDSPTPPTLPVSLSHTGRTRLISIKECYGAADTTCLPATAFQWQGAAIGALSTLQSPVNENAYTFSGSRQLIGDIRGNGRSSLILTDYDSSGRLATHLRVCNLADATSTVAGTFACVDQYVQAVQTLNTEGNTYLADVNGDGKADLVFGNAVAGDHYVCLANSDGSGFSTSIASPTACSTPIALGRIINNGLMQGDFNGDGRIDILAYRDVRDYTVAAADGTLRHKFDLYLGTATGSFLYANTFYFAASPKEQSQGALDQGDLRKRFFVADYNGDGSADLMQRMIGAGNTALDQWRMCYSRSDNSVRFDCLRDIQTVVAGTGVSSPPPLMQVNAPYQCSIPQSVLPAGGTVSWKLNYQVVNYGLSVTSTSRADVLDNGACSSTSEIRWPYDEGGEGGSSYPAIYTNNPPTGCSNGISLSLLTGGDTNYPSAGTLGQQTITVTRTAGTSYTGNIVFSHLPLSGTGILGFTGLPADITCSQAKPASVTGPTPYTVGNDDRASEMILADFNGDGLADIAIPVDTNTKTNGNWQVCLSTGDGGFERFTSAGTRTSTCKTITGLLFANGDAVTTGDFDGDGRADLLGWQKAEDGNQGWQIAYARGAKSAYAAIADSLSFTVATQLPIAGLADPTPNVAKIASDARIGDFNGDGISDLSLRISQGGPMRILSPGALDGTTSGARQEMITSVTDGLGAVTQIDYAPITDSSVYTKAPTIANTALAAGELDAQSPMQVVKAVRADNGLNCAQGGAGCDWHTSTFKYYGLRATTNGRGLLGFSQRDVSENFGTYVGSTSKTAYNNELAKWWLAGSPKQIVKTHPNAQEVSGRLSDALITYHPPRITNGVNASAALKILEVFGAGSSQSAWDLNGTVLPSQASSTASWDTAVAGAGNEGYDLDGNVLRTTATTTFGTQTHTKSSINTYGFRSVTNTSTSIARGEWILGRLTRSEVTHSKSGTAANGGGDIKRVSAFTYYDASNPNCDVGTGNGSSAPSALVATAPKGYVCDDIVEPDAATAGDQTLWSSTRHRYDIFGNRVTSTVSFKEPLAQGDQAGYSPTPLTRNLGSVTFDAKGRFATKATNALGDYEQRTFNPMFGGIETLIGPNQLLTASTFDAFGRKIRERSFADNVSTAAVVSDASTLTQWCTQAEPISALVSAATCNPSESHRKRTRVSGGAVSFTFYDKLQREVRSKTQAYLTSDAATGATTNEWAEATATYDVRGRKASASKPAGDGTATTSYLFDDLERVTKETLVGNHGAGLTPAVPTITAVTDTTYNALTSTVIRRKASTDPADRTDQTTVRETDSQGKLVKVTDAASGITSFVHDAVGNLLSVTAPSTTSGVTESMTYDVRGRKTSLTSLQAGSYVYLYNGLGELIRQGDGHLPVASRWVTVNSYDLLGRLIQRDERQGSTSSDATFKTIWTYGSGSFCGTRLKGKLCTVAVNKSGYPGDDPHQFNGPSSETRYTYDAIGRLERTESAMNLSVPATPGDPSSGSKRFSSTTYFDSNSRPELIGTAGGVVFRNHYAAWGGSAWKVTDPNQTLSHWQSTGRFADGQGKSITSGGAGNVLTSKTLDGLGRIDTIKTGTAGNLTLIQNANYDIDSFGNLVSRIDTPNGLTITPSETYQYDALNRVTGKNGVANAVAAYDALGNVTSKAAGGAYAYDDATSKRLTSYAGRTYTYDGNGNVTSDGLRTLVYAPWSLPWNVSLGSNSMKWDYDHSHARTTERSTIHGATFLAPGFELVVPTESTPATTKTIERTYIPTPDGVIGVLTRTSTGSTNAAETVINKTDYWHKDHLGSLVATTDQSGAVTQRFTFDPWGKRSCLAANGTSSTCSSNGSTGTEERGFTGHEMLDEIGLIHMNGRLYDPELGRFLQADPVIQNPLDGQNYNRYSYVGNNPLSYTDPSGFSRWTKWRRPVFALVAAIVVPWAAAEFFLANASATGALATSMEIEGYVSASLTSTGQAAANVAGGMAAGGVSGGNVQSALIGAVTAGLQFGVGQALGHSTPSIFDNAGLALQKMAAHAAIGCASAAASGGSCKGGAAAAGFSSLAGPSLPGGDSEEFHTGNFLGRVAVGAVASKLAGGKAEQGAVLAAMEYLYNQVGRAAPRGPTTEQLLRRAQIRQALEESYGPNATTLEPANWQPTARDWSNIMAVHGNSLNSLREQHLYEIWDNRTDTLYKCGVSGCRLNQNGTSGRANSQVNALNREAGPGAFEAVVVRQCVPCRADVLRMEQNGVTTYTRITGQPPVGNHRPTP